MKEKKTLVVAITALAMVALLMSTAAPAFASDKSDAQGIVDRARVTFNDFMNDKHFTWLHEHMKDAKGLLIFPQVLKAGLILGGSGGSGVLVLRDEKTCSWNQPAFYTVGSVTFGFQIGGEAAEVIMMVMSRKAVDSLLSSSFKLGGDTSIAVGPAGEGAKSNVTADFISFSKTKGIYAGINLEGSVVKVRDDFNGAYYGKKVRPADIIIKKDVTAKGSDELLSTLKKMSPGAKECGSQPKPQE
jgi:lipid-binding SYLF domain-containing protein